MALITQLVSTATSLLLPDSHHHCLSSLAWAIEAQNGMLTEGAIPTQAARAAKPEVPQETTAAITPLSKASQQCNLQGSCKGASAVMSPLVAPLAAALEGTRAGGGARVGAEARTSLIRPATRHSCLLK